MFSGIIAFFENHTIDLLIYIAMAVILLYSIVRCVLPILGNGGALRRAAKAMREGRKKKTSESWNDLHFLGRGLQNQWAAFLQNAELMDLYGDSCDVEDYINEDSAVFEVGDTGLADLAPGVFVSLGILGTFLGIVTGLSGMDSMAESSQVYSAILTLIGGMQTAFLTSICGIIASIFFNFLYRFAQNSTNRALRRFVDMFQQYGMPKPPAPENKILAIQQQQNDYLRSFVEETSQRTALQMEQAIFRAVGPLQRSMDNFLTATTEKQLEGVDQIVHRFIEHMDSSLGGQFKNLGETIGQLNASQQRAHQDLQSSYASVSNLTGDVAKMHEQTQAVLSHFEQFTNDMAAARNENQENTLRSQELLERLHHASQQQARYLNKLQEYQTSLQTNMQQYLSWMENFMSSAQKNTTDTSAAMSQSAGHIQDSAALLDSSYHAFVEQIQGGLSKALSLMDESISNAAMQLSGSVTQIQQAVAGVPEILSTNSRRYSGQVDQFVEAMAKMQDSLSKLSDALPPAREEA